MCEVDLAQHFRDRVGRKKRRAGNSMRFEVMRLATFEEYPLSAVMLPSCLASRGFFFRPRREGPDDLVECYRCGCNLGDWQLGDDLDDRHRQSSPNCPLLQASSQDKDEVPFGPPLPARRGRDALLNSSATGDKETVEEDCCPSGDTASGGCDVPEMGPAFNKYPTATDCAPCTNTLHSLPFNPSPLTPSQSRQPQMDLGPSSLHPFSSTRDHFAPSTTASHRPAPPRLTSGSARNGRSNNFLFNMTEGERRREMKREKMRLKTYANWPLEAAVTMGEVAKAGFYHIGPGDRVRCAFCFNVLRMWDHGDVPEMEHRKYFPNCPMALNPRGAGNIPLESDNRPEWTPSQQVSPHPEGPRIDAPTAAAPPSSAQNRGNRGSSVDCQTLGIVTARPVHVGRSVEAIRLETFSTWPITAAMDPQPLAEAGFFYTGTGDVTRCFFCDMALRLWKADDDAWEEHARWQPRCGFVRIHKGEQFMEDVKLKYAQAQAIVSATTTGTDLAADPLVDRRQLYDAMNSSMVRQILEMGYRKKDVSKALERQLIAKGPPFQDVIALLDAISEVSPSQPPSNQASESASPTVNTNQRSTPPLTDVPATEKAKLAAAAAAAVLEEQVEEDTDPLTLKRQNEQLKESQVCRVCKSQEAEIVFLPCGHLVSCDQCAPKVNYCPVQKCNRYIQGTIKAFRS